MLNRRDPANLRHTIFCSIIAEQNLLLQDINVHSNPPGLKPQQSRFLRLIQAISNGTKIIVTKGSTNLRFYPGLIQNNDSIELDFDCGTQRSIGYYLQYLLLICIFGKASLTINLTGITNNSHDNSVDTIQQHLIPLLKQHYHFDNQLSMNIVRRGYEPQGNGMIKITIPTIRKLNKINLEEKGYIKRIRGICSGHKISTSILNQIKDGVKSKFLQYLPDIWIYTDYEKNKSKSVQLGPGYALSLKAQTTTNSIITFDLAYEGEKVDQFIKKITEMFQDQLQYSGVISTNYQWFILTLMALSQRKTSSIKIGRISPYTVQCLRIMRDFFGIKFEIEQSRTDNMAIFRCLGIGFENYARIVK